MWFSVLGEHGLPGMTLWLLLIGNCLFSIRYIRAYAKKEQDPFWLHHADMLLGAFAAYIVAGTFLDMAYFDLFYQLVAVIIMSKEYVKRQATVIQTSNVDIVKKQVSQSSRISLSSRQ
jgi:hypothetical protein